jgi:hypothetical protein
VNRTNSVQSYTVKNSTVSDNETKSLFLVIDLENFYDSIKNLYKDLSSVYSSVYTILHKAQKNHYTTISSRIRQYQAIIATIGKRYERKKYYTDSISSLSSILEKIKRKEKRILQQIEQYRQTSSHSMYNNNAFRMKSLNDDYTQITRYKEETLGLLAEQKLEYNNFLLHFDSSLYENILLLNEVTTNFKMLEKT